jgi:hypothetical protein
MSKELSNKKKLETALKIALIVLNEYADQKNWDYDGNGNWGKFLGSDIKKYGGSAEDVAQYALDDIKNYVNINEIMEK